MKLRYLTAAIILATGCSLQAEDEMALEAKPAVITAPSRISNQELQLAIGKLLNSPRVRIATDAFTRSSRLSIQRAPHMDPKGNMIMGRSLEMPVMIQLMISANTCYVRDEKSGLSLPLPETQCQAE
ncbi:hypothetical protein [Shewanella violacea]|uniref:Lipoprotein n=1 Tax=Shewanella violacea (strain JCM 10179 / CIP 106290 / LMG 19151 / DSS12) TaxID=637905 RepID=D4ZHD6_SHEVD|nr:hypothetical protein [Shewanella violacea]BAJ01085.1 hypothetical protein SVI_1114 [Shewanella violacea DSS12]